MSKSLRVMTVGLFVTGVASLVGCSGSGSTAPTPAPGKNPINSGKEEEIRMKTREKANEQRTGDTPTPSSRKDDMPTPTTSRR